MTSDRPILAATRKGLCLQDRQPGPGAAARWMGMVLAVVLFSVDALHPIIGLVEVPQAADKTQVDSQATDPKPAQPAPSTVVSIHAWQWHPSNAEFWPAFVFQPTISAGSGNGGSVAAGASLAAATLPPSPTALTQSVLLAMRRLDQLPGLAPALRLMACGAICPIGPPPV
jgi:hypothetical protein